MSNIIIRNSDQKDIKELSQFAYRINSMVEHSSTFCSNKLENIQKDLEDSILKLCEAGLPMILQR